MGCLASLLISFLTGVLGLFCAGAIAAACVDWYRVSSFEGASGYFVVFLALLGGVIGCLLGLVVSLVVAAGASPGFFKGLGWSWGTALGISAIVTFFCWAFADIPPTISGDRLTLELEFRLPATWKTPPAEAQGDPSLNFWSMGYFTKPFWRGELKPDHARLVDGRWIVPGEVFLFTTNGRRVIDATLDGQEVAGFIVPLPGRPGKKFEEWSPWYPAPRAGDPPWPDTKSTYRFRVRRIIPPPPPAGPEELEEEKFEAVGPDSPLADWLPFMAYGAAPAHAAAALRVVESRQPELADAIRSDDPDLREMALHAVIPLTKVDPAVSDAVLAEGRAIADALRKFNAMPDDAPDYIDVQGDLRSRFGAWTQAWWTVHRRTGADGRPPVQEILDLALVRAGGIIIDEIVVNARAHLDGLTTPSAQTP